MKTLHQVRKIKSCGKKPGKKKHKLYLCKKAVEADELKIDVIHSVAHGAVRRGIPVLRLHREILVKTRWRFAARQWPLISQAQTIFISVVCDVPLLCRGETERSLTQYKRLVVVRRRRGGWENKYRSFNTGNTWLTFNHCCVGNSRWCGSKTGSVILTALHKKHQNSRAWAAGSRAGMYTALMSTSDVAVLVPYRRDPAYARKLYARRNRVAKRYKFRIVSTYTTVVL